MDDIVIQRFLAPFTPVNRHVSLDANVIWMYCIQQLRKWQPNLLIAYFHYFFLYMNIPESKQRRNNIQC